VSGAGSAHNLRSRNKTFDQCPQAAFFPFRNPQIADLFLGEIFMFSTKAVLKCLLILMVAFLIPGYRASSDGIATSARIQPYPANPSYWQYQNRPVLLLGGSSEDNIFQLTSPDLDDELDHLRQFGGNYLRCTMSGRDIGNVYPFYLDTSTQKYDLARWNDEYWKRFDYFLKATQARDIIVQIEIWATYDFIPARGLTLMD
jgi:hypothetical protein